MLDPSIEVIPAGYDHTGYQKIYKNIRIFALNGVQCLRFRTALIAFQLACKHREAVNQQGKYFCYKDIIVLWHTMG